MHKISNVINSLSKCNVENFDKIEYLSKYALRILSSYSPKDEVERKVIDSAMSNIYIYHKDNISDKSKFNSETIFGLQFHLRSIAYVEVNDVLNEFDSNYLDNPHF